MSEDAPVVGAWQSLGPLTDDGFLGGRLRILQPRRGFRAAIDSVLLPAAISPENGLQVLDAGAGVGVAALCLLARAPAFQVTAIEIQEDLAALAGENARRNGLALHVQCKDLLWSDSRSLFDQVMSNPPYLDEGSGTPPQLPSKVRAQVLGRELGASPLGRWIAACLAHLKPNGVLTLIHRADRESEIRSALDGRAGDVRVLPLMPRQGEPARRILVQARLGATGAPRTLPCLMLHGTAEKYTAPVEAILRHGAPIDWGDDIGSPAP